MKSVRCFGETKFFRQCPRHLVIASTENEQQSYCWEHMDQRQIRIEEEEAIRNHADFSDELQWEPIGAFISNREELLVEAAMQMQRETANQEEGGRGRLQSITEDEQNVHTPEIQYGSNESIKKLKRWAQENNIETERDLYQVISTSLFVEPSETESLALDHIQHCYQWNDDTNMFGVTYPQLSSWVWARVNRDHENRELLRERFFEEVSESAGQCLNGNMARLVNVFAAIDPEMSPQECGISKEQLQFLVAKAVKDSKNCAQAIDAATELLKLASVPIHEWNDWLESVKENFE